LATRQQAQSNNNDACLRHAIGATIGRPPAFALLLVKSPLFGSIVGAGRRNVCTVLFHLSLGFLASCF